MIQGLKPEQFSWEDGAFMPGTRDVQDREQNTASLSRAERVARFAASRVLPYSGTEGPADIPRFPPKVSTFMANRIT